MLNTAVASKWDTKTWRVFGVLAIPPVAGSPRPQPGDATVGDSGEVCSFDTGENERLEGPGRRGAPGKLRIVFVRVAQRQGWDVELIENGETLNFATCKAALEHALSLAPDWIELGEVLGATVQLSQHHRWATLRRQPDGSYERSGLAWGRPPRRRQQ